jgi:hypothetical protein
VAIDGELAGDPLDDCIVSCGAVIELGPSVEATVSPPHCAAERRSTEKRSHAVIGCSKPQPPE